MKTYLVGTAFLVAALTTATTSHAEPTTPREGWFTPEAVERVRAKQASQPPAALHEATGSCVTDAEDGRESRGVGADNDGCHYARGSTLICHVFVDHDGGSWSLEEQAEAGAKAFEAKQLYLGWAPSIAYMTFDHEESSAYYYYNASLSYDINDYGYFESWMVDDAAADLGFNDTDGDGSRIDQMTRFLQGWGGGWDNVIVVFQPADYHFNPATASLGTSWVRLGVDHASEVWAHEWGHSFGACDEYSSADCGGLYCPEICQSWYLTDLVPNGNCELAPCGAAVNCLMRYNWTGSPPCSYTQRNWAWTDSNDNGLLDPTQRWDHGDAQWEQINEIFHNGWFIHSNPDRNFVANQRWNSWSAIGVRSRGDADWGLQVYGENNHEIHLASSFIHEVKVVVGDFNHNNLGQDHIALLNTGGSGQYVLSYEAGNGMLFADGVERTFSWSANNVVRAYDVPLVAGETLGFLLDPASQQDLGMALFRSSGDTYYAPLTNAEWIADANGPSGNESHAYEVPETDVYGLVVWSPTEVAGDFSIKIGPTLATLAHASPFTSGLDLRLFQFTPSVPYWAVTGVRPAPGTNVRLQLYEDSTFETLLQTSGAYPNVEFVAADYGFAGISTDYLRVARQSGAGSYTTEWEQGADLLAGFDDQPWDTGHVCKVWDVHMQEGQEYMVRQYESLFTPLDLGLFLMSSADGGAYKSRSGNAAGTNTGAPGGEWLTYTAPADGFYGVVVISNDSTTDGNYKMAFGPRVTLTEEEAAAFPNEVIFTDFSTVAGSWTAMGSRADEPGSESFLGLWDCESYGAECPVDADASLDGVGLIVVDGNHEAPTTLYARSDRWNGPGTHSVSFDNAPGNDVAFDDPFEIETADGDFDEGEVVHAWDLAIAAAPIDVKVTVTPLDPSQDLGVAIFTSADGDNIQSGDEALVAADAAGPGTSEVVVFGAPEGEVYGLIVTNENGEAGAYRIEIRDVGNTVAAPEAPLPTSVALRASGTRRGGTPSTFEVDLPEAGRVGLDVFDVQGRLVRSIVGGSLEAGTHRLSWDGRTESGAAVRSGVYFARLVALGERRALKVVHMK